MLDKSCRVSAIFLNKSRLFYNESVLFYNESVLFYNESVLFYKPVDSVICKFVPIYLYVILILLNFAEA